MLMSHVHWKKAGGVMIARTVMMAAIATTKVVEHPKTQQTMALQLQLIPVIKRAVANTFPLTTFPFRHQA